jgi:hypothetical protein
MKILATTTTTPKRKCGILSIYFFFILIAIAQLAISYVMLVCPTGIFATL